MSYQRTVKSVLDPQVGDLVTSRWSGSGAIHRVVEIGESRTLHAGARTEQQDVRVAIVSVTSGRGRVEWACNLVQVNEV